MARNRRGEVNKWIELAAKAWDYSRPLSLGEVAHIVGCHRNNIVIIERNALAKIRAALESVGKSSMCKEGEVKE